MSKKDTPPERSRSRRTVLKAIGATGAAAVGGLSMTGSAAASQHTCQHSLHRVEDGLNVIGILITYTLECTDDEAVITASIHNNEPINPEVNITVIPKVGESQTTTISAGESADNQVIARFSRSGSPLEPSSFTIVTEQYPNVGTYARQCTVSCPASACDFQSVAVTSRRVNPSSQSQAKPTHCEFTFTNTCPDPLLVVVTEDESSRELELGGDGGTGHVVLPPDTQASYEVIQNGDSLGEASLNCPDPNQPLGS